MSDDRHMRREIRYVELKSGHGDSGPASICWVTFSKTGTTIYFRGRSLRRIRGGGIAGNYEDTETGEEYWVSGVKLNRQDRHSAGRGDVQIDPDALDAYQELLRRKGPSKQDGAE